MLIKVLLLASYVWAAPLDPENYTEHSEKFADIPNGAVIEGSVRFGGTQPDYIVDMDAPALQQLWRDCREIGSSGKSKWDKVGAVVGLVRRAMPHNEYESTPYLNLIDSHRAAGRDVPISEYIACQAGVCRENAVLTHLALKEAGIPNQHVYAKTEIIYEGHASGKIENHGFVIVPEGDKRWIADSYWAQFNGYDFDELLRPDAPATSELKNRLPFALDRKDQRRIVKVNSYPRIWKPKVARLHGCPAAFHSMGPG